LFESKEAGVKLYFRYRERQMTQLFGQSRRAEGKNIAGLLFVVLKNQTENEIAE